MPQVLQKNIGIAAAAVTLVTTSETLVAYSGLTKATTPTLRSIIRGWCQVLAGTNNTGIILRIRRGNGIAGAVVAGGFTETLAAAATLDFNIVFAESLSNIDTMDYSLTVQQVAASANGTVNLASIETEFING